LSGELPNTHEESVIGALLSAILVINLTSVNEVLEAAKGSDICSWKLDDKLDLLNLGVLGKLLAVVWRLGTEKIFLDAERSLIMSDEEYNKDRMRIAVYC
jgi:hypothetical protein